MKRSLTGIVAAMLAWGVARPCLAELPAEDLSRLANMSLEELMNTEVTAFSGRPGSRLSTPAAITVLTAEDIRRNGHRSVVEALRMVPGMFVGRTNSSSWVAGARGLTGSALTSNRYLVLVDGRLVYDPLVSVTNWDVVDVPLANLERIEVIRGPGATLWGVNAMNGVINVITRAAADTTGTLVQAGGGSQEESSLFLRHGALGEGERAYRAWLKYDHHGGYESEGGLPLDDEWSSLHAGFRFDGVVGRDIAYTLQGDAYTHPEAREAVRMPVPGRHLQFEERSRNASVDGGSLLFRAMRGFDDERGWTVRGYYDRTRRDGLRFAVRRDTVDVEYRRWLSWNASNQLIWGAQYDLTRDDIRDTAAMRFDPDARQWSTLNLFVQNTTTLADDRVFLLAGTKVTKHSFVASPQLQPTLRLWWTPSQRQTWWAAVSRPVRVPSRFEEDGSLVYSYVDRGLLATGVADGVIVPLALDGSRRLRPETLVAWEAGHRLQVNDRWAIDTSVFHHDHRRLIEVPAGLFGELSDQAAATTTGGDVSVSGRLGDRWRVEASYSRLHTRVTGPVFRFQEDSTPRELAQLHSYLDIGANLELNAALYHVGAIRFGRIPAYTRADVGLSWRPRETLEFSLWGQNLLDHDHRESSGARVPRSWYAQVSFDLGQ